MIDNFMIAGNPNSINGFIDSLILALPNFYFYIIGLMVLISIIAFKSKQLTLSGTMAAFILGSVVTFSFGTGGLVVYLFFIILAGVFSRINSNNDIYIEAEKIQEKGSTRDWIQVLCNSGPVLVIALLYIVQPHPILLIMFGGSVCEAVCDTASGEIGMFFQGRTVSILTGRPQKSGLSGGISGEGTIGGFIASLITAMIWYSCFFYPSFLTITYMFIAAFSGLAGCFVDSLLGASIQAHYYDELNDTVTEKEYIEGKRLELVRGVRFFNNDRVNLMSNIFSVFFALLLGILVL